MTPRDTLLALGVSVVWGLAFVLTRYALETLSPALLLTLRFVIAALPVLVLPRPAMPFGAFMATAATLYVGQFMFQYGGIALGVPPGLAAVLVQSQAFFTVLFALLLFGERPTRLQAGALTAAGIGLLCIAGTVGGEFSLGGFLVMMGAPVSFAAGNILLRRSGGSGDMLALTSWMALVPPLPGLALALATDGAGGVIGQLVATPASGWLAVLYLAILGNVFAYAVWGRLIARYPAASITPFALLVPVVAAASSAIVTGERFGPLRGAGMALVFGALAVLLLRSGRTRA